MTTTQKTVIGIKLVNEQFQLYSVTFNGYVPGDSNRNTKDKTIREAKQLVSSDPDYRVLDATLV